MKERDERREMRKRTELRWKRKNGEKSWLPEMRKREKEDKRERERARLSIVQHFLSLQRTLEDDGRKIRDERERESQQKSKDEKV